MPSIIYEPRQAYGVRNFQDAGFAALIAAGADMIIGNNKPWEYYLGLVFGNAAIGTGIPGAAATLYAIGDTVDALLFKSPDGSSVRIYLNGIAHSTLDTYAASAIWEAVNITGLIGGQFNRIDIVNDGPSSDPGATGIPWLALGPVTVTGTNPQLREVSNVATDVISYSITDSDGDGKNKTVALPIPSGKTIAQIQAISDEAAPLLDAISGGVIAEAVVTLSLTLPGTLDSAADAGVKNEIGALLSFNTDGPRRESLWIPAVKDALYSGESLLTDDVAFTNFITFLTTAADYGGSSFAPRTPYDHAWSSFYRGKRAIRRK